VSMLWALIPLSFLLLSVAIWAFFWAVDHDQMENLTEVSAQILEFEPQNTVADDTTKTVSTLHSGA
jgi:cbb3-type cytochrome oxidase maturation protein